MSYLIYLQFDKGSLRFGIKSLVKAFTKLIKTADKLYKIFHSFLVFLFKGNDTKILDRAQTSSTTSPVVMS